MQSFTFAFYFKAENIKVQNLFFTFKTSLCCVQILHQLQSPIPCGYMTFLKLTLKYFIEMIYIEITENAYNVQGSSICFCQCH